MVPVAFGARIVSGAFCGAALASGVDLPVSFGALAGAMGAVTGTLVGYGLRIGLVRLFRVPDFVVAFPEDVVAILGGFVAAAIALR
jgi:uncharacterized membrane protein